MAVKLSDVTCVEDVKGLTKGKGKWSKDGDKDMFTPTGGEGMLVSFFSARNSTKTVLAPQCKIRAWLVQEGLAEAKSKPKASSGSSLPPTDKRFWWSIEDEDIEHVLTILPEVLASREKKRKRETAQEAVAKLEELGVDVPAELAKIAQGE
ncbi:MAG: hypothetical protein HOJ57_19140 [Lentisphaerae bacterium]|jgi:hypothetical protein|nr:hypothetical protein [Lentisphaerota bacterium]MBT5608062.1 hypothetical protein [Lentisphaerota bacterium]MBT7056470.1 hypothetical protein [Lentisphaerota bacterium]